MAGSALFGSALGAFLGSKGNSSKKVPRKSVTNSPEIKLPKGNKRKSKSTSPLLEVVIDLWPEESVCLKSSGITDIHD